MSSFVAGVALTVAACGTDSGSDVTSESAEPVETTPIGTVTTDPPPSEPDVGAVEAGSDQATSAGLDPIDGPPLAPFDGPRLRPVEAILLTDGDGIAFTYDVSPDGQWTVRYDRAELCLYPVDGSTAPVCDGAQLAPSGVVRWSPDSSHVVVSYDVFGGAENGPIGVLAIDGSVTTLFEAEEVEPGGFPTDTPFAASSLDSSTVVTMDLFDATAGPAFSTIGIDGAEEQHVVTFGPPADTSLWIPFPEWVVHERAVVTHVSADDGRSDGVWRLDLDDGSTQLVRAVDADTPSGRSLQPIDVGGDRVLLGFGSRIAIFSQSDPPRDVYEIVDVPTGRVIPIPERDDDRVQRYAALSPDGEHVAVMSQYVGDDPSIRETAFHGIAIATVTSLAAGEPEWFDLPTFAAFPASPDLGVQFTPLVWERDDLLLAEMDPGLFRIVIEPVE